MRAPQAPVTAVVTAQALDSMGMILRAAEAVAVMLAFGGWYIGCPDVVALIHLQSPCQHVVSECIQ
jgi:hypothetical protein